jgi:hypothetical protein
MAPLSSLLHPLRRKRLHAILHSLPAWQRGAICYHLLNAIADDPGPLASSEPGALTKVPEPAGAVGAATIDLCSPEFDSTNT